MGETQRSAIESWKASIPKKAAWPHSGPEDVDPVVQAYLETKMALFRSIADAQSERVVRGK